ncbi:hypothetical protein BH09VER1_BH09VER1_39690 [soil metagenome]
MARPSLYSALIAVLALIVGGYILSLSYLPVAWDAILSKLLEKPPEDIWAFFDSNHHILIHVVWAVIIFHVVITIIPPLHERLNPRWYSHLAVLVLAWAIFLQGTFAPPSVHAPAPPPPPAKATKRTR